MIVCPNCQQQNSNLGSICVSCGAFLQASVQSLDLFSTIWQMIETPRKGLNRVALAKHKNYSLFLASLYGIGLSYFLLWLLRLGDRFDNLQQLLFTGAVLGPPAGILHVTILTLMALISRKFFRVKYRVTDFIGVATYAAIPVILGVIFILPIEVMTFGQYLFTQNPSPFVIKPVSYVIMVILDGITVIWSLTLFVLGLMIIGEMSLWKSILFGIFTLSVSFLVLYVLINLVL